MTNRERFRAVLGRESYDRMPCINFGYWPDLLEKWAAQGHIKRPEAGREAEGNANEDEQIARRLGFDYNLLVRLTADQPDRGTANGASNLTPEFEPKLVRRHPDGAQERLSYYGTVELHKPGIVSAVRQETEFLLKDRASWEKLFLPRLQFDPANIPAWHIAQAKRLAQDDYPVGIRGGSLFGQIRNMLGLENLSYMQYDDPDLYDEIIRTVGECVCRTVEYMLGTGIEWDYVMLWEDICYNNGPLISPELFREKVGPFCRRICDLMAEHGVHVAIVDCDGDISALLPTWVENGINTMFPIEVSTWGGSYARMHERYGARVSGIGGMNKELFTTDKGQIDRELERLRRIAELGGYIPCPDHALVPDSKWELVQYYTDRFRTVFG